MPVRENPRSNCPLGGAVYMSVVLYCIYCEVQLSLIQDPQAAPKANVVSLTTGCPVLSFSLCTEQSSDQCFSLLWPDVVITFSDFNEVY